MQSVCKSMVYGLYRRISHARFATRVTSVTTSVAANFLGIESHCVLNATPTTALSSSSPLWYVNVPIVVRYYTDLRNHWCPSFNMLDAKAHYFIISFCFLIVRVINTILTVWRIIDNSVKLLANIVNNIIKCV